MISDFRLYLPTGRQGFQVEEFTDLTELFSQFCKNVSRVPAYRQAGVIRVRLPDNLFAKHCA